MSTRADFYVGRGPDAEWIGSVSMHGYPGGLEDCEPEIFRNQVFDPGSTGGTLMMTARTEADYRAAVAQMGSTRDDFRGPERGWPWPWDDSSTTDYAYAFDDGQTWATTLQMPWWLIDRDATCYGEPREPGADAEDDDGRPAYPDGPVPQFPDMTGHRNARSAATSGVSAP